jgi:hypothetical protein
MSDSTSSVVSSLLTLSLLLLVLAVTPRTAEAQAPEAGTFGISATIQDSPNGITSPATIGFPIWLNEQFVLAPEFGLVSIENSTDRFVIGADGRFVFERDGLAPYIGPGLRILNINPEVGDSETELVLSGFGGAEYFFSPNFSMSVEGRLEILTGDNTFVSTVGLVRASVYF